MSRAIRKAYQTAVQQAEAHQALAADAASCAKTVERISRWSVAQQLEHIALVNRDILARIQAMLQTPDVDATGRVSFIGCVVFWTGYIPRGRGQAPTTVLPQAVPLERLQQDLRAVHETLVALAPHLPSVAAARARTPHPALGRFTAAQWLRFIPIHNHHHDKIMREILRG